MTFFNYNTYIFGMLMLLLTSCNSKTIQGSGNITNHQLAIENYNQIELEATLNLVYEAQPDQAPYLMIEGDDNLLPLIDVNVKNNKLEIKQKDNINPTKLTIYTNSPSLKSILSKGVADIHLKGPIAGDEFNCEQRGIGNLTADNLIFTRASFIIKGKSDFMLSGQIGSALYELSGNGNFRATGLQVNDLDCQLKGSGYMQVNAQNKLSVEIKGNGNIEYIGSAELVKQNINGVGTITKI